jgi:hypothetical protein
MVATPARRLFLAWSGVNEVAVVDLTAKMSAFSLAWTQVSLAAVILMGALGAVTGKRIGAICRACASARTIDSEQIGQLQDPFPRDDIPDGLDGQQVAILRVKQRNAIS